jgi:hypothetical protein
MRRLLGGLLAFVVLVAACGEASKPGFTAAPPSPAATAAPAATAVPAPTSAPSVPSASSAAARADHLVLRVGQELRSVDTASGRLGASLPLGVPDAEWSTLYTTVAGSGTTSVRALDVRTGAVLRQLELAGSWVLPTVVPGDLPVGLADTAGLLVLVDAAPGANTSRFAIVDTALTAKPRPVTLNGRFEFDAIGPDGRYLFLIEQLDGGHYHVRAYNTQAGELEDFVVVDKREIGEAMEGLPMARATTDEGAWAYTLYTRADGTAFVHQLDTLHAGALCVDLPDELKAITPADQRAWRITANPASGGFVANDRLGFLGSLAEGELGATDRLTVAVRGLAAGPGGYAYLLEPTVLSVFGPRLQREGYGPTVEGSSFVMTPSRDSLYVLTFVGRVDRVALGSGTATAAGSMQLDGALDWTNATLVGVAED